MLPIVGVAPVGVMNSMLAPPFCANQILPSGPRATGPLGPGVATPTTPYSLICTPPRLTCPLSGVLVTGITSAVASESVMVMEHPDALGVAPPVTGILADGPLPVTLPGAAMPPQPDEVGTYCCDDGANASVIARVGLETVPLRSR